MKITIVKQQPKKRRVYQTSNSVALYGSNKNSGTKKFSFIWDHFLFLQQYHFTMPAGEYLMMMMMVYSKQYCIISINTEEKIAFEKKNNNKNIPNKMVRHLKL